MRRFVLTLAAVGLLVLPDVALAQGQASARTREPQPQPQITRQQQARANQRNGQVASMADMIRNVEYNRQGSLLDIDLAPNGFDYVATWEYPNGTVSYITVDGRTGRLRGN